MVMFIAGAILMSNFYGNSSANWLARAWSAHRSWSVESELAQTRPVSGVLQFAKAVPGAYVPDLSASRLTLVQVSAEPFTGTQRMLLAGYRGSRGCKISFLVFPSAGPLEEGLSHFRDGDNEAYGWRAGDLSHLILSDGMDSARFRLLAESVRQTSFERLPLDEKTRLALRESRDASAPCTA